jgi:hypothetical protein
LRDVGSNRKERQAVFEALIRGPQKGRRGAKENPPGIPIAGFGPCMPVPSGLSFRSLGTDLKSFIGEVEKLHL